MLSKRWQTNAPPQSDDVLILVLMEYALEAATKSPRHVFRLVLILVLMEYALEESIFKNFRDKDFYVLILVLMEYALEGTVRLSSRLWRMS